MLFNLLSYRSQAYIFAFLFAVFYLITPLVIYFLIDANSYMLLLAKITFVAMVFLVIGFYWLPRFLDIKPLHLIPINGKVFVLTILGVFIAFMLAVILTADSIPLWLAFKIRNHDELAVARAEFLKARQGFEIIFVYINAILTTSILPYAIILCFVRAYPFKWLALLIPYLYSFIFIEKAFFLKFILPFSSYCAAFKEKKNYKKYVYLCLISIPLVFYINTVISGFGAEGDEVKAANSIAFAEYKNAVSCQHFYSADYGNCANTGRIKFITWRIFAVPVFTASDSLKLFETKYQHQLLLGRSSAILSLLLRQQNIKFEREVFNFQWGGEQTGTASANAVYVIEQFINFGWMGVILSSLVIGYIFNVLRQSKDAALGSLGIIFSMNLFFGGFISTLLSGGFLLLFLFLYFFQLE